MKKEEAPTPGQIKKLLELGCPRERIDTMTFQEASMEIGRRIKPGQQRQRVHTHIEDVGRRKREEEILRRGLRVGTLVMANLRGRKYQLTGPVPITAITPDGYVSVQGSIQLLPPTCFSQVP